MINLPIGWQLSRLNELCEWGSGGTPRRSEASYFGDAFPWITISDLNDGRVNNTAENLTESGIENSAAKLVPEGTVLVALYGSIGKLGITTRPSTTNQAIACALPDEQAFDHLYLFHFLRSKRHELGLQGTGVTQKNIYLSDIRAFEIPVAPRVEQTRIVAKLEELLSHLDAGVTELKAAEKKLAQYRQSLLKAAVEGTLTAEWRTKNTPTESGVQLLQRILTERRVRWGVKQLAKFEEQGKNPPKDWQKKYSEPVQPDTTDLPALPEGWAWASVEQISSDERYSLSIGPFGSNLKVPDYRDAGVPLVFVRNIRSGNYGGLHTKYVTLEKALELCAHSIVAGDVLVTKMGEPPGDADVYPSDQPPAVITADCIKIRCWPGLMEPEFLKVVINSNIGKRQIEPMTQGVAQKKVSLGRFTNLAVPVPPADEQVLIVQQITVALNEAYEQLAAITISLKQSAAQRQNILRAAFSGQLVPQDPNDEPASELLSRIRAERTERVAVKKPRGRQARAL